MSEFTEYVDALSGSLCVFKHLLSQIETEEATWKPGPDRWSILETLCHIIDIEVEDFRTDLDIILFRPEDPWPGFDEMEWVTSRFYNEQSFPDKIDQFVHEREKSVHWLKGLEDPDLDSLHSGNGSGGKRKSAGDIMVSWIAHDLFHIRQLSLLRFDLLNRQGQRYSPSYSGFER